MNDQHEADVTATPSTEDTQLVCICCDMPFWFSAGERRYFEQRGLSVPKRCATCRSLRRGREFTHAV